MNEHESLPISEKSEKQRRWDEMAERVGKVTDKLEKPIDEGIKEGIIALNLFDINTSASCEGHIDHGVYAPWIDIQGKIPKDTREQFQELFKNKGQNEEKLKELSREIERRNLEEQRKILPHLDEFYHGRDVPSHKRLIIENISLGRLESQGVRFQKIEDEKVRQERLQEYREEMNAFISVLKDKYFQVEK